MFRFAVALITISISVVCPSIVVWAQDEPETAPEGATLLFPAFEGTKYGFMNASGEMVIPARFDPAPDMGFHDGVACVRKGLAFTYIDKSGASLSTTEYTSARRFAEGLAPVMVGGKAALVERDGFEFHEVAEHGKWGYIDTSGKIVIEPQYDRANLFSDGVAAVAPTAPASVNKDDVAWGYIDRSGVMVIQPRRGLGEYFSSGLAPAHDGEAIVFIKRDGSEAFSGRFADTVTEYPGAFAEGLAPVRSSPTTDGVSGKWGYIDTTGAQIIEPNYELASVFSEGLAAVRIEGRVGYVNARGEMVIEPRFGEGGPFRGGFAPAALAGVWGYINPNGNMAIQPHFTIANPFENGLAFVNLGGQRSVETQEGAKAAVTVVEQISGGEEGYIDSSGEFVHKWPSPFDRLKVAEMPSEPEAVPEPDLTTLTELGQEAPYFIATAVDGSAIDLKDLRGKPVAVVFVALWSGPSIVYVTKVAKILETVGEDKIHMLVIARDATPELVAKFSEKHPTALTFIPDPDRAIFSLYANKWAPRSYVVDSGGKIVFQERGGSDTTVAAFQTALEAAAGGTQADS